MTNRGRITTALSVPAIRLQTLVRSRTTALIAIVSINILGISAPIVARAAVVYPLCTAASPIPEVSPNGCLFGPPFPGFEMDGNTAVDTLNGVDWDTNPFPYPRTDFNLTQNEIDLALGSKYLDQSTWICTTSDVTPQKVELLSGSTAINTFINGHQVGFFDFARQAPNGDAFIDYVFSRGTPPASPGCPQLPARQVGDVVVTFTLTNGGSTVTIDLARWNGTGFDSIGSGSHGVDWMAAESADGTYFEGGVDFTDVFFNGSGGFTCHSFASVYMDSRSSGSGGTSEMKDVSGLALPPLCKNPTVATQSSSTGSSVAAGTVVHDTATVTGVTGSGTPTGSVDFHLCGPLASASGCTTGGTDIGSTSTSVSGTNGSGNPTATYTSANTLPVDAIGTYCWRADYTAALDGNYTNATGPIDAAHECFTVVGATSTSTTSSVTGAQLPGVSATDTATVTLNSPATGAAPTGTVTFKLCNPSAVCTQVGSPVGLTSGSATSSAVNGTTTPNTLAIGKYCWEATYNPTGNYLGSAELSHPDGECFTTAKQPTTTTTSVLSQTVDVSSNSATVGDTSNTPVFVPANVSFTPGTVTFRLYGPSAQANCTTVPVYTSAAIPGSYSNGNVAASTGTVGLATAGITQSGTYWWVATYSGDAYNNGSSSGCGDEPINAVDASIKITPNTAVNEVGHQHVFTITLTAIPAGTTPTGFSISPSISSAIGLTTNSNTCGSPTIVDANTRSCTYTINTATAGTYTLNATGSVTMGGLLVTRSTSGNSGPGGSGPATKHYVDAFITITPNDATNIVGNPHTFTITLTAIPDDTGMPSGFSITPAIDSTTGLTQDSNTCGSLTVVNANTRQCTYTINSSIAATYTLNASGSVTMGGVMVTRSTSGNSGPGGSGPATKHYVSATLTITPNTATNEVGQAHTFTITLTANPDGSGPPSNFQITPSLSPTSNLTQNTNTCGTLTVVDANTRSCTYTINSNVAGTYTLNATGQVTIDTQTIHLTTMGGTGINGPATKHYVDAFITITPQTKVNEVGSAHTFTITLTALPDDAGAPSNFSITPTLSPLTNLTANSNTCSSLTVVDANMRQCTYTINSDGAGTYTLNASGSVTMGGVTVTRSTSGNSGPGGSGAATKHYIDASISITPNQATNVILHAHTFTITLTAIPDDAGAPSNFSITPSLSPTTNLIANSNTCATPTISSNTATCTYTINSSAEGTYTLNATGSVTMGGVTVTRSTSGNSGPGGSGPAVKHYIAPNSTLVKAERDVTTPDLTQNGGGFTAGPITAHPLDVLEYRLTYTNTGQGAASQVTVTDVVPVAHSAYVASSCTGGISCSYNSGTHTLTWDLGTVNGGGTQLVLTFQIKLTNDFPVGATTQISNAAVVTTFEEGSKPSNTVVANVFIPVQQVQAVTVTLPKAGSGPLQQIMGQGGHGGVIAFAGSLLLIMICAVAYESIRRPRAEAEDPEA